SSFLWGYIFSSVIGGALVDRYGGKRVLAWGVLLWSLATLLTPLAANHSTIALLAIRAFFGLAEGVALPSMSTLLSRWFPNNERATAFGISMAGFHIGNVYNVNLKQAAWFSAVPWATMAISGYLAGTASDFLINAGYPTTFVRKFMQTIGFIGPAVTLICLNYANTPTMAATLLTAALSLSSFSQAGFMLNIQDIAPQYAGTLHGISNSAGTLAAIISTIGTGDQVL
ncbi:putative anion transporter chloroplastic-like, partial [Trifolium pratense]